MYYYAVINMENNIVYDFYVESSPLNLEEWVDCILVDAVHEDWIQRKRYDAATQQFVDVLPSEAMADNSLEFTHIDANGTKHWLDDYINDLAEDVAAIDPTDFAAADHTHSGYAASSHKHYAEGTSATGKDLNNYTDAGIYTFTDAAAPANVPAGTNGWLVVVPWIEGSNTVKQLWFRHGTVDSNDFETYVRTKIGTSAWGSWSKYYTTSNPPTPAEIGAASAFTSASGGVKIGINVADGKNLLDEIDALATGVYTIYSQSGVSGNPKTTEAWRMLVHKTSATIGWVMAFGSSGSVYANYQNEADHFQGWRCVYDATNSTILWTGAYYMHSPSSTPQVVTPSKKLSECRTGWLLLWSDYDASTSTTNDSDFCTTYIPKYNPSGGTWGGKAFYCDIPMYVGSDVTDTTTEQRCIKPVYIHDDHIEGSYQNNQGGRNDVVLRAVYEI